MEPGGSSKTLRRRLQRQLEFYLSESNLRQDKFLQQSMDEQGFVAIDVFVAFNKLKAMGATARMVRDAAEKSTLLRVSADRSAIAPLELPFDKDDTSADRTLYIENFSADDDHDSLRRRFAKFGKVNLVSMPRFPQSRRFKGFAFVEFGSAEAVARAVKAVQVQDPDLQGLRAMPKTHWQAMKEQLKEQLAALEASEQTHRHDVEKLNCIRELEVSDEPEQAGVRATSEQVGGQSQPLQKKKRKKTGGHIRFDFDVLSVAALLCGMFGAMHEAAEAPETTLSPAGLATERGFDGNFDALVGGERAFTPEPALAFQPFGWGWRNDYIANNRALCSGEVAGFTATPLRDADCREPFQFLLGRGTDKVRYGCIKCDGNLHLTPTAAPYATCNQQPVCSELPLAYLSCFLKNDTTDDMFSCLMSVDFRTPTYS